MNDTKGTAYSPVFYTLYRFLLKIAVPLFLDFRYKVAEPVPPGPKIIAGNHPTVLDVFPPLIVFDKDIVHTLIEEQIWSLPLLGFLMRITNQVKMYRGVQSVRSIREATAWLRKGESLLMSPEAERTSVDETRAATQGIVRLAVQGRAPIIPTGVWVPQEETRMKPVQYHYKDESYTVDSYFPRFRARYAMVFSDAIHLDEYYGQKVGHQERQKLADMVLEKIYALKEEARRLCED